MTTTYKLDIFKDSRENWTETSLNTFINITSLYFIILHYTSLYIIVPNTQNINLCI